MGPRAWGWIIALAAGCRCDAPAERTPRAPPHYGGFDDLVASAAITDAPTAQSAARDMMPDGEGMEGLGGALGFIQIALDRAEIADGTAAAAAACGKCHGERSVSTVEPRPPFAHATAAEWAVWGAVWNAPIDPPTADEPRAAELVGAWSATSATDSDTPATQQQIARVITACQRCHPSE